MPKMMTAVIDRLDAELIDRHKLDLSLFSQLDQVQRELGVLSGDRPFSPFLRPHFMTREFYREIAYAAETLASAFETMTIAALEDDAILAELSLTETEERYARMDPGYGFTCNSSRLDSFIDEGSFKFLEYNGETPAGITDQLQIEKVLNYVPEVRSFLSENENWRPKPHVKLLGALDAAYRDFGGKKEKPNIAIVDWKDVSTFSEFVTLQEYFESEGFKTVIIDPDELDYDGRSLTAANFEIDIFYKRVLIHEFFDRSDEDHPLRRAYRDGNVCMANSFRTKIPHKKASFAVVGNERYAGLFTDRQLRMIRRHLPWTRLISDREARYHGEPIELLEFVRSDRERLILKPNDDYGGSGIVIGWESTESEWDDAIEKALTEPYVVQERAAVERVMFPTYTDQAFLQELLIDFDPFLFMGKVEGGLVRLSPQSLVNVAAGGGETALVLLEGSWN